MALALLSKTQCKYKLQLVLHVQGFAKQETERKLCCFARITSLLDLVRQDKMRSS